MAESEKIKSEDIIAKDLFKNTQKSADQLTVALNDLEIGFISLIQIQEKILKQSGNNAKVLKQQADAINKSKKAREGLEQVQKAQIDLLIKEQRLKQAELKTQADITKAATLERKERERIAAQQERQAKATEKLNTLYAQESKRLNELRKQFKDLVLQEKGGEQATKNLQKEILALDKKLKDVDASVGQFQRHVGDYKNQVKEALSETLAFGGGLGQVVNGFKQVYQAEQNATEGANKFGAALKATGIGLVIAGALLLKEVLEANQSALDELAKAAARAKDGFGALGNANLEAVKSAIEFRDTLRSLQEQLQATTLDQEDFNEISEDTTIGFQTRNKALEKSIELGEKAADIEIDIAKGKLAVADAELKAAKQNALGGKALEEAVQKQFEAAEELKRIEDKRADFLRINDERRRKRDLEQASFEIDLILKKKQNANAEKTILEQRLADEKVQLEERERTAKRLLEVNKQTTSEEIRIFKEKIGVEFDANKLIAEQDAVRLQRRIEGIKQVFINEKGLREETTLGSEQAVLLAKIIKQAQDNQIENAQQLKKLEQERIERLNKIAEIERNISLIESQQRVEVLQKANDEREQEFEKSNEQILQGENVFNRKKEKIRQLEFNEVVKNDLDILAEKRKLLDERANAEKESIKISESDEKVRAAKIKEIDKQLEVDKENLDIEFADKRRDRAEKEAEQLKKIELRKTEIVVENLQKVTNALQSELDKRNQVLEENAQKEIDLREQAIEKQTKLAEDGQANQLAFELQQKEKAELEKQELEEKAAREREVLALVESYENFLLARLKEPNADPNAAPYLALKDTLLSRGVAKSLAGFFFEGTEKVENDLQGNKIHNGRDGYVIGVDGKERILTGEQNKLIGNMTNDELSNLAYLYNTGVLGDVLKTSQKDKVDAATIMIFSKIKDDIEAIKNKPVQIWEVNSVGQLIEKRITGDMTKKIIHKEKYKFH